jgi:hypothetical protein
MPGNKHFVCAVLVLKCLCCTAWAQPRPLYFATSGAAQSQNSLGSVSPSGGTSSDLFTATGPGLNNVSRCTAVAVDNLNGLLFFLDSGNASLWSVNLNGGGLTLVASGLTNYTTDLALDVLNEKIYYTTSSAVQNGNTIQRLDYTGSNNTTLFTGTGASPGNGVSRCTAIAVDVLNGAIFIADAGSKTIWKMHLDGGSLASVAKSSNSVPTDIAVDPVHQQLFFTLSSPIQSLNSIQRVGYDGLDLATVFSASGGVQRCTALDMDLSGSTIYFSDAGADTIWQIPIVGGSASSVLSGLNGTARRVRFYSGPESRPSPGIAGIAVFGTGPGAQLVVNGTNGYVGGTYYIVTSTNLALPLGQWTAISTNILTASGGFTLSATASEVAGAPGQYYVLKTH